MSVANGKLDLSLRASRIGGSDGDTKEEEEVADPEIESLGGLAKDQVLQGYVKAVTDVGVFVR